MDKGPLARLFLCAMLCTAAVGHVQPSDTFERPMYGAYRLDYCLTWAKDCGQPVADQFCRWHGYLRSAGHEAEHNVGGRTPTYVVRSDTVCKWDFCGGFEYIECENAGAADAYTADGEFLRSFVIEPAGGDEATTEYRRSESET